MPTSTDSFSLFPRRPSLRRPDSLRRPMPSLAFAAVLVLLAACGGADAPPETTSGPATPDEAPVAPPVAAGAGEDLAPVTSRDAGASEDGATLGGTEIVAPGAVFTLPAHWTTEQPSSSMRLAQAAIPGDAGEATLTVFHFGPGGGGGVDANLQRWVGQMEIAPGTEPTRDLITYGNFTVHWIEVEGTIQPSTMGVGPTEPQPDSRLLGAVIEGPGGPWFFKATGPSATLAAERDAFHALLMSARAN